MEGGLDVEIEIILMWERDARLLIEACKSLHIEANESRYRKEWKVTIHCKSEECCRALKYLMENEFFITN